MNNQLMEDNLRAQIIANPNFLLEDHAVMRALVGADDDKQGSNVVDLRSVAMERLEARFDRLEDVHRNVIAAAYDNLAGTNQVHSAILRLMDATSFDAFLDYLTKDVTDILRIDAIRLVLESETPDVEHKLGSGIALAPIGFVAEYVTQGRNTPARQVTLRPFYDHGTGLFGNRANSIQSEACLSLDLGPTTSPGLLIMGSTEPHHFTPQQGTDLLTFFASFFERNMRRWLA